MGSSGRFNVADVEARRQARQNWPVTHHLLEDDPGDDLSAITTPQQRVAMMAELAEEAWRTAGRTLPSYQRREMPGRLFPPGAIRSDDDT